MHFSGCREDCSSLMLGLNCFPMDDISPQLRDFVLFCARRRGLEWPVIYDEMTRVAGQRLFQGLGHQELRQLGLSFSLSGMEEAIRLVGQVASQSQENTGAPCRAPEVPSECS
jgi:hypothetical protein